MSMLHPEPEDTGSTEALPLGEITLDIELVQKDACMLVIRCEMTLSHDQLEAVQAAVAQFRADNPGLPPIMVLPKGMSVEALTEDCYADSVQP